MVLVCLLPSVYERIGKVTHRGGRVLGEDTGPELQAAHSLPAVDGAKGVSVLHAQRPPQRHRQVFYRLRDCIKLASVFRVEMIIV